MRIAARRGVLLGAGGFARNDELRSRHHPGPSRAAWSSSSQSDLGDAVRLGIAAGGATALMDEVWGGPSLADLAARAGAAASVEAGERGVGEREGSGEEGELAVGGAGESL